MATDPTGPMEMGLGLRHGAGSNRCSERRQTRRPRAYTRASPCELGVRGVDGGGFRELGEAEMSVAGMQRHQLCGKLRCAQERIPIVQSNVEQSAVRPVIRPSSSRWQPYRTILKG